MTRGPDLAASPRHAATIALAAAARQFPDLRPLAIQTDNLSPADAALALAIGRTAVQRWITIEYLLDIYLKKPMASLEPALRGLLLGGGAQLLFLDRLPAYAVVDQTVSLAGQMVRPGARGLVNAVLRKLAGLVGWFEPLVPWRPGRDSLPWEDGVVHLTEPVLPDPANLGRHLVVATSHPGQLVDRWVDIFGPQQAKQLCRHGVTNPPIIVAVEDAFDRSASSEQWTPHDDPGFILWQGSFAQMTQFLGANPQRRVQDPGSARAVLATAHLPVTSVLDYCAGRGTKTRQLAITHPAASIIAAEPDRAKREDLQVLSERFANIHVAPPDELDQIPSGPGVDLLLLDVPCSNTGVLARRPEARYRYSNTSVESLVNLQQQIIRQSLGKVRPGGWVLYSTCSLEPIENQQQAQWLVAMVGGKLLEEVTGGSLLPAGRAASYRDGGYFALIQLPTDGKAASSS